MGQFDAAEPQLPNVDALTAQIVDMRDYYPESQVAHVVYEPHDDEAEPAGPSARRIMPASTRRSWPPHSRPA